MEENRDWRDKYFGKDYYLYLARHLTSERTKKEVSFLESVLGIKRGNLILDLGCGFGRHTLELGKKGYRVIGIDRSEELIEIARDEAKRERVFNVEFYVMDYSEIDRLDYKFDMVFTLYTSFGLSSYKEDRTTVEKVYNILKKGGKFLIDIENRDALLRYFIPYSWDVLEDQYILLTKHQFEPETGFYISVRTVYDLRNNVKKDFIRKIYLYTASELSHLLEDQGFYIERFIGDYEGHKYHVGSRRLIVLGVKK